MATPDWRAVFDVCEPNPPCPADWLPAVSASVTAPLYSDEKQALAERDAPALEGWSFPARQLPPSYLAFLGWANGGTFVIGDREFGMLKAEEVRQYMLDYFLPYHMPGAVPFAADGAGGFYLFDLRQPPDAQGEYPVLHTAAGQLGYDSAVRIGDSFEAVLRDGSDPNRAGERGA